MIVLVRFRVIRGRRLGLVVVSGGVKLYSLDCCLLRFRSRRVRIGFFLTFLIFVHLHSIWVLLKLLMDACIFFIRLFFGGSWR